MKSTPTKSAPALGMDERLVVNDSSASLVRNMRIADNGMGWTNDRGWEPLIPDLAGRTYHSVEMNSVISGFVWERTNGAERYFLQENASGAATSSLFYLYGNRGTSAKHLKLSIGDADRRLPKPDDAGTQYIPFGRMLVIVNGVDPMWKFWGRNKYNSFGFTQSTPAPDIARVDVQYQQGHATDYKRPKPETQAVSLHWKELNTQPLGLGDASATQNNSYTYRITFVTDSGSESPMSGPVSCSWVTPVSDPAHAHNTVGRYGVLLTNIPKGPKGTVARRLYRSKNQRAGTDGAGDTLYYVHQLSDNTTDEYCDVSSDGHLGSEASVNDSVIISDNYKFGTAWNGSMWLAGSETNPNKVIYSEQGRPEQFGRFNYFDVGVREGGAITGVVPFFNNLIVFRKNAIDMVQYTAAGNGKYSITTISSDIGTTACNTAKIVPGVGLVFLASDGIYAVSGGTQGGSTIVVNKISNSIQNEMKRINKHALARATAVWSAKEDEYWVHYPSDGVNKPNRGAVLHASLKQWSLRNNDSKIEDGITDDGGYKFNWLGLHPDGWILLGPERKIFVQGSTGGAQAVRGNIGIQVWSAADYCGNKSTLTVQQDGTYTFASIVQTDKGDSIYASKWDDYGNPSLKKRVHSVELSTISTGYNPLALQYATNWKNDYTTASSIYPVEPETESTNNADFIFGPITNPAVQNPVALMGTAKWENDRLANIRWDVSTGLITNFKWRVKSNNYFLISTYKTNITSGTRNTIASGAGGNLNG